MIGSIHEALRQLLYRDGQLPEAELDISFAVPTRDWASSINRPTLNFYLYDIAENLRLRMSEFEMRRGDVRELQRLRPRRIDLKYMINVFFKSQLSELDEQEWQVLWRVLATLIRNSDWPDAYLPPEARELDTPIQGLACYPEGAPRPSDIWGNLGASPRPGLHYVLTVPLDLNIEYLRPLVLDQSLRFRQLGDDDIASEFRRTAWRLLDPDGEPVVGADVRLPDRPGLSVSQQGGAFYLDLGHSQVRQLLVRLPGGSDWTLVNTTPGTPLVTLA